MNTQFKKHRKEKLREYDLLTKNDELKPNRKKRRESKQKQRFAGNHKGNSFTIHGKDRYRRIAVQERDDDGQFKWVFHYLLCNKI